MKKTKHIMKKLEGALRPQYQEYLDHCISEIKEGQLVECLISKVKRSKSPEQLGYLYSAVYPFIEVRTRELGYESLYTEDYKTFKVDVKITIESIDHFFKKLFESHSGKEFLKREASMEEMCEYIDFIDRWSIKYLGKEIPE